MCDTWGRGGQDPPGKGCAACVEDENRLTRELISQQENGSLEKFRMETGQDKCKVSRRKWRN